MRKTYVVGFYKQSLDAIENVDYNLDFARIWVYQTDIQQRLLHQYSRVEHHCQSFVDMLHFQAYDSHCLVNQDKIDRKHWDHKNHRWPENWVMHEMFLRSVGSIHNKGQNTKRVFPHRQWAQFAHLENRDVCARRKHVFHSTIEIRCSYLLLIDRCLGGSHCFVIILHTRWTIHSCPLLFCWWGGN